MNWQIQGRQEHGWFGNGAGNSSPDAGGLDRRIDAIQMGAIGALPVALRRQAEALTGTRGMTALKAVMPAWIGGARGEAAMRAVGWTVRNRMTMPNGELKPVVTVWGAYRHGGPVTEDAKRIARDILNGTIPDPTGGATHFYSPQGMPKEGEPPGGMNIWGGLESVPGVTKNGVPVRNSRPDWTKVFEARHVNGVPESVFKFFRDNSQDKKSKKGQ